MDLFEATILSALNEAKTTDKTAQAYLEAIELLEADREVFHRASEYLRTKDV